MQLKTRSSNFGAGCDNNLFACSLRNGRHNPLLTGTLIDWVYKRTSATRFSLDRFVRANQLASTTEVANLLLISSALRVYHTISTQ